MLSGSVWNPDHLDINLESIHRDRLGVDDYQDLRKVDQSPLWRIVRGMMPCNALAVYVPLARQTHDIRLVVKDEVMLAFQDFTASIRVQCTSEQHPLYVLPHWVSHIVILLPGGKEIPLPSGYSVNLDTVFMVVGNQGQKGKGSLPNAFAQIAAQCVRILPSTTSVSLLMVPNRQSSMLGRLNTI